MAMGCPGWSLQLDLWGPFKKRPKTNGFHWIFSSRNKWSYGPLLVTAPLGNWVLFTLVFPGIPKPTIFCMDEIVRQLFWSGCWRDTRYTNIHNFGSLAIFFGFENPQILRTSPKKNLLFRETNPFVPNHRNNQHQHSIPHLPKYPSPKKLMPHPPFFGWHFRD